MEYTIDNSLMSHEEIQQYLNRIGIEKIVNIDLENLKKLQYAHLTHIPYENYDSLNNKLTSLNHKVIFDKIITHQRGGICFELNGLYAWLLTSIGFNVKSHLSRFIIPEDEIHKRTHRVMTITIEGTRYLTDVGVNSECARIPLILEEKLIQSDGISLYRFEKEEYYGWILWQKLADCGWRRLYAFTEELQLDMDYIMSCTFCDIHPLSGINKFEKVSLFTPNSNIRIWNGKYQEFSNGRIINEKKLSDDEKIIVLKEKFGIII